MEYKLWIRDLFRSYVNNKAVLYTIDGCGQSYFDCGPIPEVYATVDFGISVNGKKLHLLIQSFCYIVNYTLQFIAYEYFTCK